MSTNENETVTGQENEYVDCFEVIGGVIRLKEEYRGDGDEQQTQFAGNGDKLPLPDVLVIPNEVNGTPVEYLASGMFYNNKRVKEIVLPSEIKQIPAYFCANATNLRVVNGTEDIEYIGYEAFKSTRIKEAMYPNLKTMSGYAFAECGYLEIADIGTISAIPQYSFKNCALLYEVRWKEDQEYEGNGILIGSSAFRNTRSLRELPLLALAKRVEDGAFFGSRISTALPEVGLFGAKAFPTFDNKTDFWTGVELTPCDNRIVTKLSQSNSAWKDDVFLLDEPARTYFSYEKACALFAVMHIHSAITENIYNKPSDFVKELNDSKLSQFLYYDNWPGRFDNVAPLFEALGYCTEVHGTDSALTREDYQAMVDALAKGAYVYAQVSENNTWINGNKPDGGHAVVIYGINELGEVRVLDSQVLHEAFRDSGAELEDDVYTYTIPYQNIVGPGSNFVIVYPNNEVISGAFTSVTLPSALPTGVNVSVITTSTEFAQLPERKRGNLMAYHLFSDDTKVLEEWWPDESATRYLRYAKEVPDPNDPQKLVWGWSDWYVVAPIIPVPQKCWENRLCSLNMSVSNIIR